MRSPSPPCFARFQNFLVNDLLLVLPPGVVAVAFPAGLIGASNLVGPHRPKPTKLDVSESSSEALPTWRALRRRGHILWWNATWNSLRDFMQASLVPV